MKVLVTGAFGSIGKKVVNKLIDLNCEVIATGRNPRSTLSKEQIKYFPYNISERKDIDLFKYFEKPDAVIHLAWEKLEDYKSDLHTTDILEDHKRFVLNLKSHGLKSFIGVGTCFEYGLKEGELSELNLSNPVLPYAIGKFKLLEYTKELFVDHNMNFKWIRLFYLFGEIERRTGLFNQLELAIKNRDKKFKMSGGMQIRDFLSPENAAEIICLITLQNEVNGIINCCSGRPVRLKDFISDFLKKKGANIELDLGAYPYSKYEPMECWGSTIKMIKAISASKSLYKIS